MSHAPLLCKSISFWVRMLKPPQLSRKQCLKRQQHRALQYAALPIYVTDQLRLLCCGRGFWQWVLAVLLDRGLDVHRRCPLVQCLYFKFYLTLCTVSTCCNVWIKEHTSGQEGLLYINSLKICLLSKSWKHNDKNTTWHPGTLKRTRVFDLVFQSDERIYWFSAVKAMWLFILDHHLNLLLKEIAGLTAIPGINFATVTRNRYRIVGLHNFADWYSWK